MKRKDQSVLLVDPKAPNQGREPVVLRGKIYLNDENAPEAVGRKSTDVLMTFGEA